jgi:single-strand DNA-binding protein
MPRSAEPAADQVDQPSLNFAVLRGQCSSPPEVRVLPSGQVLAQVQVTTRGAEKAVSVPVAVWSPPAWVESLEAGDEIVVVGSVRRRFFRAGGATASRVEVEAEAVARARDRRRLTALRKRADQLLGELDG